MKYLLKRVLVTGSRNFDDEALLVGVLDAVLAGIDIKNGHQVLIIHGAATGADQMAHKWAVHNKQPRAAFPANWTYFGRSGGPIRNQLMLDAMDPELVIAFPTKESKGTWDMVKRARDAGILVEIHRG